MPDHDDTATTEIARDLGRVLPPVLTAIGCPRWLLWLGVPLAVILGVVVWVVGRRLIPHLAGEVWEAIKNAKVEPAPTLDEGGVQQQGVEIPAGTEIPAVGENETGGMG